MTRTYHQFCPVAKAAEIFCERWTALLLRDLAAGSSRFSELQRGVPLMSPSLLSTRLRQLEQEHVITKTRAPNGKTWVYALTPEGEEFIPIVIALGIWGQRWTRRELQEHEIDIGLLLWALEKGAHAEQFGTQRVVVEFDLIDQPKHKRHWWYLNQSGTCELCLEQPDAQSDVYCEVSLTDLIRIWRGDIRIAAALESGAMNVFGEPELVRRFQHWLGISTLAEVESARTHAPN